MCSETSAQPVATAEALQIGYTTQAVTSFVFLQCNLPSSKPFKPLQIFGCQFRGSVSGWIWDADGVNWDDPEVESLLRNLEQEREGEMRLQPRAKRWVMVACATEVWKVVPTVAKLRPSVCASPVLQAGKHYRFS